MSGEQSISASELDAQLQADPEFQRARAERDAVHKARVDADRIAQRPILEDLRTAGFDVESVWHLGNTSAPYPAALPILVRHLRRGGYPDSVMHALASLMAVRYASEYWDELRALYLSATGPKETEALASALAASTTKPHLDDLLALLEAESRGNSRIHFLRPIKRLGGTRGLAVLQSLKVDPLFGREATALLKNRA